MIVETKISLELDQVAEIIKSLSREQLEELEMKLTKEDQELKKRLNDVKTGKVKLLSKKDVFNGL